MIMGEVLISLTASVQIESSMWKIIVQFLANIDGRAWVSAGSRTRASVNLILTTVRCLNHCGLTTVPARSPPARGLHGGGGQQQQLHGDDGHAGAAGQPGH